MTVKDINTETKEGRLLVYLMDHLASSMEFTEKQFLEEVVPYYDLSDDRYFARFKLRDEFRMIANFMIFDNREEIILRFNHDVDWGDLGHIVRYINEITALRDNFPVTDDVFQIWLELVGEINKYEGDAVNCFPKVMDFLYFYNENVQPLDDRWP
jgi:hypothetical protein